MGKINVQKRNFTVLSNIPLRDKDMSLKAKGLFSFMMSLPPNWDYTINGLVSVLKEGRRSIGNILNELEDLGYLVRTSKKNKDGTFAGNDYDLHCEPIDNQPQAQKGDTVNGYAENDTQISKEVIKKRKKKKKEATEVPPKEFCQEAKDICRWFYDQLTSQEKKAVQGSVQNDWLDTVEKCNRLDGVSYDKIMEAVKWAKSDEFWSKQFRSITKLRKKGKDCLLTYLFLWIEKSEDESQPTGKKKVYTTKPQRRQDYE